MLFPITPPKIAPATAPIPAPRCVLFVFFAASHPVKTVPSVKTLTNK